ncbi:MAG: diacylglycerol kinase [Rickettsiales bacterium]|jgi:diacylglycerol kinase (ATP)|nr:diacylglycerol kinase [Rickettsiales bacterium]
MKPGKHGIARILNAFKYSFDGFVATFKSEEAFRQDLLVCLVLAPIAIYLPVGYIDKILMLGSLFLILLMELINTGFEVAIDRISDEIHPLSKITKDIGSCLVLISFLNLTMVWGMILWQNRFIIF